MAASQIIEHQRIAWFKAGQSFVYFETVPETATLGIMVAQNLERLNIAWVTANDTLHEGDFDVQLTHLSAVQLLSF